MVPADPAGTRPFIAFRIVSAVVMLAGLVAALFLCNTLIDRERAELRSTTEANARRIAIQLQSGILAAVEPLERLGKWWVTQGKPTEPEDWATDGQLFLSQSAGLREALWVGTDGWQQWSAISGAAPTTVRTRPDERVLREIANLSSGQSGVISEVFTAPQIGAAFYAGFPVSGDGRLRGYIFGLYDARALVSRIASDITLREHRITITSGGRQIYSAGPAPEGAGDNASAAIRLADQVWTMNLNVPLHYFREFRGLILTVVGVIGALIYSFITLLALSQRWSSALQRINSELKSEVDQRARMEASVRELNRELHRKVADFETLLNVIPIGIAVADDPECQSIRVNRALADILAVPEGTNISKSGKNAAALPYRMTRNGRDLLPDELPMQVAAQTRKSVLGQEDQVVRSDGTVLDVLSFASPVFDENGNVRGILNACVDISDRKSLEQRLQRAERMKSLVGMAAGIAHDFNNLLTVIIGQASMAAECVEKESEARGHITASMESARHASALIQKVLAFTGHSFHILRPTDLRQTIQTLQPSLCAMAASKSAIRFDIDHEVAEVMADADEVRQVLHNLVLNAVEAAAPGTGVIEIRLGSSELLGREPHLTFLQEEFQPGVYVRLEVKDNGVGMPPGIAERAFDPFFSTKFLGRGLGLSEVLGIMRAYGGAVRLTTAPDLGTSVQLFFPAAASAESAGGMY